MDPFVSGIHSMARSCLAATELVRQSRWTLDDVDKWINAVLSQDAAYLEKAIKELKCSVTPQSKNP